MSHHVGRNDPCPCGSGKKFKKCCLDKASSRPTGTSNLQERLKALQLQADKQQGLGKHIISELHKGVRFIAVGGKLQWSPKWKTFHDFLFDYIPHTFGPVWGTEEFKKSFEDRHPIVQWRQMALEHMQSHHSGEGEVKATQMTGATMAYLSLSYNLYLLAHNVKLQSQLIKRLKNKANFTGAKYETYVAAEFIKAGFAIEMEDETDGQSTHCEFTATSTSSGKRYSIEAKARQPGKDNIIIAPQLSKALGKKAEYARIVFIDMNIPNFISQVDNIIADIRKHEQELLINYQPAPPAYLFVTNHPFEYALQGPHESKAVLGHGFKIPDFDFEFEFGNIRDLLKAREKHKDMIALFDSIRDHQDIPSTFDGEYPEFAFNPKEDTPRLIVGRKYLVPDKDGKNIEGTLTTACVLESTKEITGVYHTASGENIIVTAPMTEDELTAYKRQPETFFGVPQHVGKKAESPLELFDFFYETYKSSPRERLLEFMKDWPDQEALKSTSTEELAITYCESLVHSAFSMGHIKKT